MKRTWLDMLGILVKLMSNRWLHLMGAWYITSCDMSVGRAARVRATNLSATMRGSAGNKGTRWRRRSSRPCMNGPSDLYGRQWEDSSVGTSGIASSPRRLTHGQLATLPHLAGDMDHAAVESKCFIQVHLTCQ